MGSTNTTTRLGLGIDSGGTGTRWALVTDNGQLVAEGNVAGLHIRAFTEADREHVTSTLQEIVAAVRQWGMPARAILGMTGFGGDALASETIRAALAAPLSLDPQSILLTNDIVFAYLAAFSPDQGILVYAGTGSVAAHLDGAGLVHRAGGRGGMLDDGGGGFWVAKEAMRRIWRREDEQPGSWKNSVLACRIFDEIGGSDWATSRQFVYGSDRGKIGMLALTVAAAAEQDMEAQAIMENAGKELARLANAMTGRVGIKPVALAGRAARLHPLIEQSMRKHMAAGSSLELMAIAPHHAAARLASAAGALPLVTGEAG